MRKSLKLSAKCVLVLFVSPTPALSAADRFALIINGLCQTIAASLARSPNPQHGPPSSPPPGRLEGPVIILIWTRLRRIGARFAALAARVPKSRARAPIKPRSMGTRIWGPADTLPSRHSRAFGHPRREISTKIADADDKRQRNQPTKPPHPRLPSSFGWLIRLAPQVACYASQLRHLLSDPEIAALLSASPEIGRVLRRLCRMLGVRPPPDLSSLVLRTSRHCSDPRIQSADCPAAQAGSRNPASHPPPVTPDKLAPT